MLHLDSNEFENPETLALLAGLKQLKSLNLDNNSLPAIPYIKIAHGKPIERYHVNEFEFGNEENEDLQDNDMNIDDVLSSVTDGLDLASKMTTSNEGNEPETVESDNNKATDSKVDALSDDALNVPGNSIVEPTAGASAECVSDSDNDTRPPPPPFPELRYFSIAHNKVRNWNSKNLMKSSFNAVTFCWYAKNRRHICFPKAGENCRITELLFGKLNFCEQPNLFKTSRAHSEIKLTSMGGACLGHSRVVLVNERFYCLLFFASQRSFSDVTYS